MAASRGLVGSVGMQNILHSNTGPIMSYDIDGFQTSFEYELHRFLKSPCNGLVGWVNVSIRSGCFRD